MKKARYISPLPPHNVTSTLGSSEVDPAEGGLTRNDVESIWKSVETLYRTGLHPAIGLCVRRKGAVILDRAIGHTRGNDPNDHEKSTKVQATPKSLFNVFSASKAITAMVIHHLDEKHLLHLDDPVAEYIPEFSQKGKESITIRHLLTHRAGIPNLPIHEVDLDLLAQPDRIVELLCASEPTSIAGRKLTYHALTSGWVLGKLVENVAGRSISDVLQKELLEPIGITDMGYGVPKDRIQDVAMHAFTGHPVAFPFSRLLKKALGVAFEDAIHFSNDPRFLTSVIPAGNVIGTPEQICRFFEMLLRGGELHGTRVLEERTIRRAIAEQEYLTIDSMFGLPIRYSMGFVLGGRVASIYGPNTTETFGHLGFTTVMVYADPRRDISVCLATTGKHFLTPKLWQHLQVLRTIHKHCED